MDKKSGSSTSSHIKKTIELFYEVVGDLRNGSEAKTFLLDFFTDSERLSFAKRLAVAIELEKKESYEAIRKKYGVSTATISSVAEMMASKGMQIALEKVRNEEWAEKWAIKLLKMVKS